MPSDGYLQASPVSSVNQLPVEILQDIFVIAHRPSRNEQLYSWWNPFDINELPWTISRVCQTWRSIAFGTHIIWASGLDLELKLPTPFSEAHLTELKAQYQSFTHPCILLLRECLEHTGLAPLSFSCSYTGHPLQQQIISLFTPHSQRWLSFQLTLSPPLRFSKIDSFQLNDIAGRLPILQNLRIMSWFGYDLKARHFGALFQAHSLHTFDVGKAKCKPDLLFQLPLHQLTHIAFTTDDSLGGALEVLSKTSPLLIQRVIPESMSPLLAPSRGGITLRGLRDLRVCAGMETILDYIDLPALEELTLYPRSSPRLLKIEPLTRSLDRPQFAPNLRSLEIGGQCGRCELFYRALNARPRIQRLIIPMRDNITSFFLPQPATGRTSSEPFLPNLSHLGLLDIDVGQMKRVLDVLESRRPPALSADGNNLRSCIYSGMGARSMSNSHKARLNALVEGGLDAVHEISEAMKERLARSARLRG